MANSIIVNATTLKSKATELRNTNSSLKTQLDNLKTEEEALNGMWEGEARQTFHTAFNSDLEKMTNFYKAIENYAIALEETASKYEATEAKAQSIASTRTY